ncbi:hypothetical protein [Flavobacterium sp. JAS]|uniref:hypothetical protein n=1 Tax=Flavobacterium sp. JAS TaxID=2897329 RepID=UPI001E4E7AF3|nr:hypothetical protein [Flavobacterium sp. JAS]MCD0469846.1 hypothetical protein [Flavobacterium sp. JAS]
MITYLLNLKSGKYKRNEKQYAEYPTTVLKTLLSFSKVEVLDREEQINIFGKGHFYQDTKCLVYDPPSTDSLRIS